MVFLLIHLNAALISRGVCLGFYCTCSHAKCFRLDDASEPFELNVCGEQKNNIEALKWKLKRRSQVYFFVVESEMTGSRNSAAAGGAASEMN